MKKFCNLRRYAARLGVFTARESIGTCISLFEICQCKAIDIEKRSSASFFDFASIDRRLIGRFDLDPEAFGESLDGFGERNAFELHEEFCGIAAFVATKTIKNAAIGINRKAGRLFVMKRTTPP